MRGFWPQNKNLLLLITFSSSSGFVPRKAKTWLCSSSVAVLWFSLALPALLHCPVGLVSCCQQAASSGNQLGIAWQPRVQLPLALWRWQSTAGRAQGRAPFCTGLWHLPLPPSHPPEPQEMCSSNPIIALPCSSPMCFAFEIAGSLCNYTTTSNHIPFVRKSPALLAVLSLAVRQERAAQCTNSSLPPIPYLSPPVKSGTRRLGSHLEEIKQNHLHFLASPAYSIVCYQAAFWWECRFPLRTHGFAWPWESPLHNSKHCFHFSPVHFSWEFY